MLSFSFASSCACAQGYSALPAACGHRESCVNFVAIAAVLHLKVLAGEGTCHNIASFKATIIVIISVHLRCLCKLQSIENHLNFVATTAFLHLRLLAGEVTCHSIASIESLRFVSISSQARRLNFVATTAVRHLKMLGCEVTHHSISNFKVLRFILLSLRLQVSASLRALESIGSHVIFDAIAAAHIFFDTCIVIIGLLTFSPKEFSVLSPASCLGQRPEPVATEPCAAPSINFCNYRDNLASTSIASRGTAHRGKSIPPVSSAFCQPQRVLSNAQHLL